MPLIRAFFPVFLSNLFDLVEAAFKEVFKVAEFESGVKFETAPFFIALDPSGPDFCPKLNTE